MMKKDVTIHTYVVYTISHFTSYISRKDKFIRGQKRAG